MSIMVTGLVLFLGFHLLPAVPPSRAAAADPLGEQRYKVLFSLVSAVGLVLIVVGYAHSDARDLFAPVPGGRGARPVGDGRVLHPVRRRQHARTTCAACLQHPMLIGLLIWSTAPARQRRPRRHRALRRFPRICRLDLASAIARRR